MNEQKLIKNKKYIIHAYKHNGMIHRTWDEAVFIGKNKDAYVFVNQNTKVVESYGRSWRTKEAAVLFFYKNNWFNIIGQLKEQGIYYYCNIASPFIVEENIIKYIDYDLDLRVFPNFKYKTLDRNEYNLHKIEMGYPEIIQNILEFELEKLKNKVKNKEFPFNHKIIKQYYTIYTKCNKNK
jgi:Uncharacterized domain/protein associated with RNAses G and E